jgi:hypothetical protein
VKLTDEFINIERRWFFMVEEVKDALAATMMRGWKGDFHCDMVFTSERLIIVKKGLLSGFKSDWGGIGEGSHWREGTIADQQKRLGELKQLSPESILKSHDGNLDVSYSQINKAEIGKTWWGEFRLHFHTSKETLRFKFQGAQAIGQFWVEGAKAMKLENAESRIRLLLPDKIIIEKVDKL